MPAAVVYALIRCPRCESRGCMTVRCEPAVPVQTCPSPTGYHEHAICPRCGFEWISAGEVPPVLRAPTQVAISIGDAFEAIVGAKERRERR
jgi:hypothetical protein